MSNTVTEIFNEFLPFDNVKILEIIRGMTSRPIVGYFTNRVPVELLHSLGMHPSRMLSDGTEDSGSRDEFLQTFCCSWLTSIFESHLRNQIEYDGLIFSTGTCDSLQNMSDIWIKALPKTTNIHFAFPVRTQGNLVERFFREEIIESTKKLCENFGLDFNNNKLHESIILYNRKRLLVQDVYKTLKEYQIPYSNVFQLMIILDLIPIEKSLIILDQYLNLINGNKYLKRSPKSTKIIITGSMFDNPELFKSIPSLDNSILIDDLSFGSRNNEFVIEESSKPDNQLDLLVSAYLNKMPDSTVFDMGKREEYLLSKIDENQIDGVIMILQKWCDPEGFEMVELQNALKEKEIPFLVIDVDSSLSNLGQLQTRIEAFIEMISED